MSAQTLAEAITSGRGVERPFRCHVHDDRNASASVNVLAMVWVCYACGASGRVEGEATVPDAEQLLEMMRGDIPPRIHSESWLDTFDAYEPSPYWAGRYGGKTAERFRCGTHPVSGLPTYPIRDAAGSVLGVVVRDEAGQPKYKYPFGSRASTTFFGHIKPKPVVILVEGASDVMALYSQGIHESWAVLGCYGAGVHHPQAEILRSLSPKLIVLAFDNDDAGRSAITRSAEMLGNVTPCVSHPWGSIGGIKDPGEASGDEAVQGLSHTISQAGYPQYALKETT